MDTRTDPGQYYPGGRVMVRPDVAPPQVQINVSWSEIHGKPNFSEIAALGAADTLGTVKQTMNTVVNKLKTSVLIICAGMATVCAAVAPQFAALDDIPGNRQIMTNTQEYVDAKVGAVPVAGNYAVVSNAAMSALQPSATNGLITKAEVDLRFETTPSLEDISDLSDRIIAVSRSAVTTNDVCNIVTNEVDEYVMEMEGDYWMVEQTTARFVVSDVVWTPRGDGQYTVSFRANGVAKSIGYPDSVANSVICTDRDCYVYFPRLDYGLTVAEMMPELSMPNQWALTMGTTGGHDGGADSFVHRTRNALGLVTVDDLAGVRGAVESVNAQTGAVVLAAADVGAYSAADGATLAGQVATIGAHLNAEDARFVVTNYNSVTHTPEAYMEIKLPDESWSVIWREMTRWNYLFDTYLPTNYYNKSAVDAALAEKADRAWGFYDSTTGAYAPDGYTWISSERIAIAANLAYQRTVTTEGAVWVLESVGTVTETGGLTNGFFRISDDEGNSLFEIVKGDKRTIGADASSCQIVAGFTPTKLQIGYSVVSDVHPTLYVCQSLETLNWKAETDSDCIANVSWSGSSGAYVAQVQGKSAYSSLFVRATYEVGGETYISNAAPVSMQYIMINGVKYSIGTATISGNTVLKLTAAQ
ncbi:MAG: hypothetical protein IKF72_14465 [Kiritimatiellae bacterium]|nr:hypothetical protein [Kiritimatiellia bacterium]